MKRHDTPTASGRLPAALLLLLLALSGPPLRSYNVVTNPLAVTLDVWTGMGDTWCATHAKPIPAKPQAGHEEPDIPPPIVFDALSVAVGWDFRLYISGGETVVFDDDDEYYWGYCGYGYEWLDCLSGRCTHAQRTGLDADKCRWYHSFYQWYYLNGAFDDVMPPDYGTTMVANSSGPYKLLPGDYSVTLGFHNAFCVHRRGEWGLGRCHEVIKPCHQATQPVKVVRMSSVSGPGGFSTDKADSGENGYVRGFSETDWLSLPLGATGSTAVFTAAPYPAAAWPRNTPSWELMAPVQSSVDPDDRAQITVRTDTAFAGGLRAECGTSFISMQLNVVEVAAIGLRWDMELDNEGHCAPEWEDCQYWQNMDDSWDNDYAVLEVRDAPATVYVRAYSNPSLPVRKLPGEWSLTGPQGNDPLYRVLDISTPASTAYAASCGVSSKRLTVHVCGVEADGVTSMVRETDTQTGEVASEYLLLAVPDPANDQMDGTDRRATVALRPLNLLALEGLPLHSWLLMMGGNTGGDGLNHGRLYATCSPGLRFIPPDETAEAAQAVYSGAAQPCRLLDNLPLGAETTILVEAFNAQINQRVGEGSITLHYESAVAGFTDTLAVKVLDLTTDDIRFLLVNDDNDDMLAYPQGATDVQKQKPFNCVKDKDQQGAVQGEDDLRRISFPFPASTANLPASSLSISVVGNVRLWQDSQRKTELVQRVWDADEIAQIYGGLDVWVEGLAPSSSIGDVKITATWDVAGTPISKTVSLTVLEMRMAVDGGKNRGTDAEDHIIFDDFGNNDSNVLWDFGNYLCMFWYNNDRDTRYCEYEFEHIINFQWHEDDKDDIYEKDANGNIIMNNGVPVKKKAFGADQANCDDNHIGARVTFWENSPADEDNWCIRDLEDFNRLQLKLDSLFASLENVKFTLSGAPINLFKAEDKNLDYLKNKTTAENQAKRKCILRVDNTYQELGIANLNFDSTICPFIWEARGNTTSSGGSLEECDLVLTVSIGSNVIGRRKVRLVLTDVSRFYDRISSTHNSNANPIDSLVQPSSWSSLNQNADDYILIIHGFNVNAEDKTYWPGTAFKRLWWQGFKGRMGFFCWDCVTGTGSEILLNPSSYDDSDLKAWQMGRGLAPMLVSLNNKVTRLHIMAHSQGNVVAGEAIRRYSSSKKIKTYVASQAAISQSCYKQNANKYKAEWRYDNPDVHGKFPGWTGQVPYLDAVIRKVEKRCNFHNFRDYALVSVSVCSWEDNNNMRPNSGYEYEGDKVIYDETASPPSRFLRLGVSYDAGGNPVYNGNDEKLNFPLPNSSSDTAEVNQTYVIFSYVAESHGTALGVNSLLDFESPGGEFDLSNHGYDSHHYSHSRQFRSDITQERIYWNEILIRCGIKQ